MGDIFIHKSVLVSAFDKKNKTYNFQDAFNEVTSYLKNATIATAWFGGALDTVGPYTGYPRFKTPQALAGEIKEAGLDILFRTNHTLDYGKKGVRTTTQILKNYGIEQIGAYISEQDSRRIFVLEKDSLRISFLSYTYGTNNIPIPKPWMVNLIEESKIKEDIIKAKKISDFVVVALHFGIEYQRNPDKSQRELVRKIAEYGADLIIGSHPHVVQPVDVININSRKVFVVYSLGNFFCGQRKCFTDTGIMLRYTIKKNKKQVYLKDISYTPLWIAKYQTEDKNKFKILPIEKFLRCYEEGKAKFLRRKDYERMKEAWEETIKHINKTEIGFTVIP